MNGVVSESNLFDFGRDGNHSWYLILDKYYMFSITDAQIFIIDGVPAIDDFVWVKILDLEDIVFRLMCHVFSVNFFISKQKRFSK